MHVNKSKQNKNNQKINPTNQQPNSSKLKNENFRPSVFVTSSNIGRMKRKSGSCEANTSTGLQCSHDNLQSSEKDPNQMRI